MNEELKTLKIVAQCLEKANIPYMVSGSIAANYYTLPRMTRDIDIVIELKENAVDPFIAIFKDDFYVDDEMVRREVFNKGIFNLIHKEYVVKIDFIIRKESAFQTSVFNRKIRASFQGHELWLISAEDLILAKLLWAKDSRSEMQLKDVKNLLNTGQNLDRSYIEEWLNKLQLKDMFHKATHE
ncbi:MAG: hypothetical protein ABIJ41_05400 [Candidatus Omnitrophota bacterium]